MGGKRSFASRPANDQPWDLAVILDGDCEGQLSAGADLLAFADEVTPMSVSGRPATVRIYGQSPASRRSIPRMASL
jgi:hypothetical protein